MGESVHSSFAEHLKQAKRQAAEVRLAERQRQLDSGEIQPAVRQKERDYGHHILKLLTPEHFTFSNGAVPYPAFAIRSLLSTHFAYSRRRYSQLLGTERPSRLNQVALTDAVRYFAGERPKIDPMSRNIYIGEHVRGIILYGHDPDEPVRCPYQLQNKTDRPLLLLSTGAVAAQYDPAEGMTTSRSQNETLRRALNSWVREQGQDNGAALLIGGADDYLNSLYEPGEFVAALDRLASRFSLPIERNFSQ